MDFARKFESEPQVFRAEKQDGKKGRRDILPRCKLLNSKCLNAWAIENK